MKKQFSKDSEKLKGYSFKMYIRGGLVELIYI